MKTLLLASTVLLLAISVGYCEELPLSVLTPKAKGEARAQQDIKNSKMRVLYYGKPWSAGKPLVDDKSGLPVEIVAGSDITKEFAVETDAYNNLMRKAAKARQAETQSLQLVEKKCVSDKECMNMDCSKHGIPGVKEGYKPYCVESKCKCMCYGCD